MSLRAKITDWLDAADIRVARIAKAEGVEDLDAYAKGCLCMDDLAYEVGYRDALAYVLHLLPRTVKGKWKDRPPWETQPAGATDARTGSAVTTAGQRAKHKRRGSP